jgi:hypothetical protein
MDNRSGYNSRGAFPPGGPRGGMYPIQPLPPLVDGPYGGPGLGPRYPNPALLTSTRVSYLISLCFDLVRHISLGDFTK